MEDRKEKKKERKKKKVREEEGKKLFQSGDLSLREATSNNNYTHSMKIYKILSISSQIQRNYFQALGEGFTSLSTKS